MWEIQSDKDSVFSIRVTTRGRRNALEMRDDKIAIIVTATPHDGQANAAVVEVLSNALRLAKSRIEIVRGHKSRDKTVRAYDLSEDELRARIEVSSIVF